LVVIAYFVTPG